MLVVTTDEIHGWEVQRVCGEVFGVALRPHLGQGADGDKVLVESRNEVISRMLDHARTKGGNAVVGLHFDSSDLGAEGSELCAYGTAVVAVPVDEGARQTATALGYGQPGTQNEQQQQQPQPQQQNQQQQYDPNQQQYAQQYQQTQYYGQQQQYDPNQQQYYGQQYQGYGQQPYPGYGQQQGQPGYQQYPQQGYPQQQ